MADPSMQQPPDDSGPDIITPDSEIPVSLDSVEADGVRPSVGDTVTLRVEGTVKRIENDYVYVTPDAINDNDLNEILAEAAPDSVDEEAQMRGLATEADSGPY